MSSRLDSDRVLPLSIDFHTPPDAAPRYHTFGFPGTPVIDATRPTVTPALRAAVQKSIAEG